ncbi:hypothetical protein GMOD_00007869 [Pyrenophora seminiperda CCB06]|uniref:Uncharacterized protein n=1 Tax=Pyrenophora seminiperda CCB06 TaxID=1302712 RepID=A0A3M7MFV0_9PLEO|nr:hypothetical protein GMOD_00007869 [Pyrenophora seminiperda CCB06]
MDQYLNPTEHVPAAYRMLHRIVCHMKLDQQKNWTAEIGPGDYVYADKESKAEARKLWGAHDLGDEIPKPLDLLHFLRAEMVERGSEADRRAARIFLSYNSSLGSTSGSIVKIPARQLPQSAFDIVFSSFLHLPFLNISDFFDPNHNTSLLRDYRARYKTYIISAPYMLKKDSFVLLWVMTLWAPKNLKAILEANGIVCEQSWLDNDHVERLFQMYKSATWDPAEIRTVRQSYSCLSVILHAVHRDEGRKLVRPTISIFPDQEEDGDEERELVPPSDQEEDGDEGRELVRPIIS